MLQGKTALVTGASRGIGRAIAQTFAHNGCNVAVVYAGNAAAAAETVSFLTKAGVRAQAYRCDISIFEDTSALVQQVLADFGQIDILINNAGITRDKLILQMAEEDFTTVLDTNLKGAFNMIRHLYTHFMRKRSGRIISIGSVIGQMGNKGQANYAASKAALVGLSKSTARELAARGVTCNVIQPGFIETEMTSTLPEAVQQTYRTAIPAARFGTPQDVAQLAAFLASDAAQYITGQVINVDGGLCM